MTTPTTCPGDIGEFLREGAVLQTGDTTAWIGWGGARWSDTPAEDRASFYAPDFYLESPAPWLVPRHSTEISLNGLSELLPPPAVEPAADAAWREPSLADFAIRFAGIKRLLDLGKLRKAVPVAFEAGEIAMTVERLGSLLLKLIGSRDATRLYGVWDADAGILGATPELLFQRSAGELKSVALAGTRLSGKAGAIWDDPKEIHEHQLVVDDITAILSRFGRVTARARGVLRLPGLEHFQTAIDVALDGDADFETIARALHPTAALGVYPRHAGWRNLREWDGISDRGRFGAPFGIRFPDGSGHCVVAIRNLQWAGRRARIGAGCGLVNESHLEREWAELALKRASVKRRLGL